MQADLKPPSSARRKTERRHRVVEQLSQLRLARRKGVDVCVARRGAVVAPDWLDAVAARTDFHHDVRDVKAADVSFSRWLAALAPGAERDRWQADLELLLATWVNLVGDIPLRVQLSTIENQKCPRFHVDNVGLRLLCTYAGPGTEWISEQDVDRDRLRTCGTNDLPLRATGQVQQVGRFDVLVMKGSAWPGNGQRGAVHRSPAPRGQRRLVLTLDTQHLPR